MNISPDSDMTRHQRVRDTFEQLIDLPEADRPRALEEAGLAQNDRRDVERLLAGHARQRLFGVAALEWVKQLDGDDYISALIGKRIGACELRRFVGRGGSALVFLARRRVGGASQDVALKLLNSGLTSPEAHRRFRREQAILSRLSHPNIARLIDAGIADSGAPFIAMEYIEGSDIVDYSARRSLDLRSRIGLLVDLCRAVDAAHRELIVHRDLKPSNVLVTQDGVVKVLDFGIAKLIDDDHPETATQHIALTPAYAAPEQFQPGPAATSMDVYSLGVLASELLLGGRLGPDATLPANDASSTWQRWRRIDTDLAHILRAALASEPARRYSSAGHLADDFVRYLRREPLQIVPVSRWYRARKFASRHRGAVSAAALLGFAVLAGIAGVSYQWRVAQRQAVLAREQATLAQEQATRATEIRDFLVKVFEAGNAEMPQDKQPRIEDIVADAQARLLADSKLTPSLRADLLLTLADVSSSIGSIDRSEQLLDEVERTLPRMGDSATETALKLRIQRAGNALAQSTAKAPLVLELLDPVLPALEARQDRTSLDGLLNRARALQATGRPDDALAATRALVERYGSVDDTALALDAMSGQVSIAVGVQHFAEAAAYSKQAIAFWESHGRPETPLISDLWGDTAIARESIGDMAGAEEAYRMAIAICDRVYAHPTRAAAMQIQIFGTFLLVQGRVDEAEAQIRRALQMEQAIYGDDDPRTAQAAYAMGRLFGARRDFAQAIAWTGKAVDLYRKEGHSEMLARAIGARARFHAQAAHYADADRDIQAALAEQKAMTGDGAPGYAWILEIAADIQLREHLYEEALRTTDRILAINAPVAGGMVQATLVTRFKRAKALAALERAREALVELEGIEPVYARIAPKNVLRFDMAALRAQVLARLAQPAAARDAAKSALELISLTRDADAATVSQLRALAAP